MANDLAPQLVRDPQAFDRPQSRDPRRPERVLLPVFVEELYRKRFGRARPEVVLSIEELAQRQEEKRTEKREAKLRRRKAVDA